MSYYPIYGHPPPGRQPGPRYQPDPFYQPAPVHQPPPGYYPLQQDAQTGMPPVPCIVRQIVPINSHLVHVTETLTVPGELLPRTKPTSHREREASEAYDHHPSQSKPKNQSVKYDQHGAHLEQPLPPKQAIGYQAQLQIDEQPWDSDDDDAKTIVPGPESSRDNVGENGKDKKKPTSSQRVRTKGEREEQKKPTSSQRVRTKDDPSVPSHHKHTRKLINSQPYVAETQDKRSLVDSVGDERKHTTKDPTSVPHSKTDSKRRPEKPAEQAKERRSTTTTNTARAHTTAYSSSNRPSTLPRESRSRVKITTDKFEGSVNLKYDEKRKEFTIPAPVEKSTGRQSKKKGTGSSRGSQSKKSAKEEVLTDSIERGANELPWHMEYREGKNGNTVRR